ncbi:DUF3813 domain-containing protein [Bacillus massiliglaciei]|uniref:DUF3813 domain-containing protein n=1 Tax=Bacillus massiliglaciei TaxID=1816693 RepID=UPI000AA71F6E|nr:DUF3813 domain-containing protein [Bacillus massiliglaciei]
MGNKLFQEARHFVEKALHSSGSHEKDETASIAKNALSSAYANSTNAEKEQLRELQEKLDQELK